MDIRPMDLPDLRADTIEYVNAVGIPTYLKAIEGNRQHVRPRTSPMQAARILAEAELDRLGRAELFYVSADMTDLAVAAAVTLPAFTLMPEDVPARCGLLYFNKPIDTVAYFDTDGKQAGSSPIVAASWSQWTGNNQDWVHGGLWITWYADRGAIMQTGLRLGLATQKEIDALMRKPGRLLLDNETQCPFSPNPIPSVNIVNGTVTHSLHEAGGLASWLGVLKTTWLLMSQPMADVSDAAYDRAARRRLSKDGATPPRVRVIELRRPPSDSTSSDGEPSREYHHQWIVRGHWRQQWYPARQVHRPVWIAPHVKGPEGAPLLGAEKVHTWSR